jgi:hypothetical protein
MRPAPWLRVVHALVALCALSWVIAAIEGGPSGAAMPNATAGHHTQAHTPADLTTGQKGVQVHGHKEGLLAVSLSVLGVVIVVAFIVGLGSLSARRRSRGGTPVREWLDRWRIGPE